MIAPDPGSVFTLTKHPGSTIRTLYLIHHTHTDVGYTGLQGRVARWQSDFIHQALDIIEQTGDRRCRNAEREDDRPRDRRDDSHWVHWVHWGPRQITLTNRSGGR